MKYHRNHLRFFLKAYFIIIATILFINKLKCLKLSYLIEGRELLEFVILLKSN